MILAVNAAQTSYSLADGLQVLAKIRRGQTQQFPRAMEHAIETFPEAKEFQPTKELIISRWTKHLTADLPTLMLSPRDLKSSRKAYLNLVELKSLDPSNSELKKLEEASANFGSNLLERASELENVPDYSRIATAFLMKLCAKQLLREGIVKTEELKDAVTIFNRKRASQILFSVEDLVGAPSVFRQTVEVRTKNVLEDLGLPDLRVRSLDDYRKSPNEDPQFEDLRPDGKSSTVLLTVAIAKHESERKKSEQPVQKASRYISGDYQEFVHKQHTTVELRISLRDYITKEPIDHSLSRRKGSYRTHRCSG
jgi:hypothetical protein